MNRSLRSTRSMSSKSESKKWTKGEDFDFRMSPSPRKKSNRRQTNVSSKKDPDKAIPKTYDRRKSTYLKRLESDISTVNDIEMKRTQRATRRKSMVNIPKIENKTVKNQIPRVKSEKTISKKTTSKMVLISPRVKLENLEAKQIKSKSSQINKKSSSKFETSVNKESFYSLSPLRTRQTRRQSIAKMSEFKLPTTKVESAKNTSDTKSTKNTKLDHKHKNVSPERKLPSPKGKKERKMKTEQEKLLQKQKLPSQEKKTKETVKTLHLKKPVKRLSTFTPSPILIRSKRLTRSSTKKKVKISAESPLENVDFRKTPKVERNKILPKESPIKSGKLPSILKPYTPKPEEPLRILKNTLKNNVATEMRNNLKSNIISFSRPSLSSVRTPSKIAAKSLSSSVQANGSPTKLTLRETPIQKEIRRYDQEHSYSSSLQMPSTPVSSRKSSVSFRRFRGSVRLMDDESFKEDKKSNISLENPLSSTPVQRRILHNEDYSIEKEHDSLMDMSELSSTQEESKCTLSSSYSTNCENNGRHEQNVKDSNFDLSDEKVNSSQNSGQTSRKSYCSLM